MPEEKTPGTDVASPAFGCVGNTIKLFGGSYFDLANPKAESFTMRDIGSALSKICRFGGHVPRFYSVAEHSLHCYKIARADNQPFRVQAAVLFHDAAEAFIGDMVKPLKVMFPEYSRLEERIEAVIAEKFGIDFQACAKVIKDIDHAVLMAERRLIFGQDGVKWFGEDRARRVGLDLKFWEPKEAEHWWLRSAGMQLRKLGYRGE